MEELNRLALDIFDNKYTYKEVDYINLMDNLKKQYLKLKGIVEKVVDAESIEEDTEEDEDEPLYYHNDSDDEDEGYLGNYIDPY